MHGLQMRRCDKWIHMCLRQESDRFSRPTDFHLDAACLKTFAIPCLVEGLNLELGASFVFFSEFEDSFSCCRHEGLC